MRRVAHRRGGGVRHGSRPSGTIGRRSAPTACGQRPAVRAYARRPRGAFPTYDGARVRSPGRRGVSDPIRRWSAVLFSVGPPVSSLSGLEAAIPCAGAVETLGHRAASPTVGPFI